MADRGGELDVAHALAAHLALGDLDAAAVADLALVANLFIFAAVALPVLGRSENALAEQAVALGLEGAVVDDRGCVAEERFLDDAPVVDLGRLDGADGNHHLGQR